ncbi:pentatricopeptide repeat-containing protein At1g03100, mitochondrial [Cannabis sativa]|uniref:pentatricopeptide repeat-containing protein At1g03100, mitochondrial n=1 Tax=Cannabis sativa TaxID=3483 RepID=UPI0029C9FC8C|nr:pentatricopeptide repeat-containing protein At1g03100, mitochondrial [Cannabis sativa]
MMMIIRRKMGHQITALFPTCVYKFKAYSSSISVHGFTNTYLANLNEEVVVLGRNKDFPHEMKSLSTMTGTVLVQAGDPAMLSVEIENSLDEHRLEDTWKFYEQHMQIDGFPRKSVVNKLLVVFAESLDVLWLEKAFGMVERIFEKGKKNLLQKETLIYLSLSLAKVQLSVPASTVMRKLVEMEQFPPVSAWSSTLAYMCQTGPGASLAAELILEIGYLFQDSRIDPRKKSNAHLLAMKPNTTAFNIALVGCLLFGIHRKAEQLLDMMPRVGVKLDSDLLIVMAHIYERNGRREELRKLQRYINDAHNLRDVQLRQFYNCLLSCHLKLGDLSSASKMVLEMLQKAKAARSSSAAASMVIDAIKNGGKSSCVLGSGSTSSHEESRGLEYDGATKITILSYEDYLRDQNFVKLDSEAKEVLNTMLVKLQTQVELLTTEQGIILPTEKILVKLVKAYLEAGKTKDLAEFLIKVEREDFPVSSDDSMMVHVINSCIVLGWLDQAHDLLDEIVLAGFSVSSSLYSSLLKAYCHANRAGDVAALLRDARRAGIQLDSSSYQALLQSKVVQEDTQGALHLFKEMKVAKILKPAHQEFEKLVKGCEEGSEAKLMGKLLHEIKEGQRVDSGVHDWNNVIHFFSRKRLMQDAEKALKKMKSLGHTPNAQTFHSMITAYAAIGGNYTEVTEMWGEMKSLASATPMKFDQELLDSVLYTFVRGGFFSRANEVVEMMERGKIFVDKYKYRTLFLKYHKTLYRGKTPKFQTEGQHRKREEALIFKRWVGLN